MQHNILSNSNYFYYYFDYFTNSVQLSIEFNQIKDDAGDSFYVRVGFDRTGDLNEGELRFVKDEVLYVSSFSIFSNNHTYIRAFM